VYNFDTASIANTFDEVRADIEQARLLGAEGVPFYQGTGGAGGGTFRPRRTGGSRMNVSVTAAANAT
jgi:hypothetical protein